MLKNGLKTGNDELSSTNASGKSSLSAASLSDESELFEDSGPEADIIRQIAHVSVSDVSPHGSSDGRDPLVGQHLGQFEVLARIGKGGMGVVYKAQHVKLRRKIVALKVLSATHARSALRRRLLEREAQLADAINHRNIAQILDFDEEHDNAFVVMEYIDGQRLGTIISARHAPIAEMLDYAEQIAAGLAAAHNERIVHRDLSPNNVMVTQDGVVKILDFGLSKLLRVEEDIPLIEGGAAESANKTSFVTVNGGGTPGYMAPEQLQGATVDARVDVYSFGVLLGEMIASSPDAVGRRLKAVQAIVAKCTQSQADKRYKDGKELVQAFRALRAASRKTLLRIAATVVLTLAVVVLVLLNRRDKAVADTFEHVKGRNRPGCAGDNGITLKASAYMPTESAPTLRFYITRDDDSQWLTPGKLTVFVGDGPTCAEKPFNVRKVSGDVVVGNKVQILELPVRPYDGAWTIGEEKQFWVGLAENGWLSYRASGPVVMRHVKIQ
jgi:serine/threonine protein kinase